MQLHQYDPRGFRVFTVILLVLLSVVISSGAIYLFFTNQAQIEKDNLQSQIDSLTQVKSANDAKTTTTATPTPTTTTSPSPTASTTTTVPGTATGTASLPGGIAYTNTKFGFQLVFPQTWAEYKVGEKNDASYGYTYYFGLPYTDKAWIQDEQMPAGSASLFALTVFTKAQWAQAQADGGVLPTVISSSSTQYVFAWSEGQANPTDLASFRANVESIINSFSLTN